MYDDVGAENNGLARFEYMSEDEKGTYNYLCASQGKNEAEKYLKSLDNTLNQRLGNYIASQFQGDTAMQILYGLTSGADRLVNESAGELTGEDYSSAASYAKDNIYNDLGGGRTVLGKTLGQHGFDIADTIGHDTPSFVAAMIQGGLANGTMVSERSGALEKVATERALAIRQAGGSELEAYNAYLKMMDKLRNARTAGSTARDFAKQMGVPSSLTDDEAKLFDSYRLKLDEGAGNFKAISSLDDFKSKVPSNAQELPWRNIDGGAAEGVKYRWTDVEGNVWNVRAHSIDPNAPLGSNAGKGWVYRVEVRWGGTGKKYFMDTSGKFHPENVIRPNSPMYNEAIANDTHIVFGNR